MAKESLDWFKLDCRLNEKFELIEAEYGLKGFAVLIKLYQRIYGSHGYYCDWNKEVGLLFSKQLGLVGDNSVSEIVASAIKRGIFDNSLYEQFGILTSKGIQERYFETAVRRKNLDVKTEYLLVKVGFLFEDVSKNTKNVNISSKNDYIFSQSRVEEKREEKIRKEESREEREEPERASLTDDQYDYLVKNFSQEVVSVYLDKLKKYPNIKDVFIHLKKWMEEDEKRGMSKKSSFNTFEQRDYDFGELEKRLSQI